MRRPPPGSPRPRSARGACGRTPAAARCRDRTAQNDSTRRIASTAPTPQPTSRSRAPGSSVVPSRISWIPPVLGLLDQPLLLGRRVAMHVAGHANRPPSRSPQERRTLGGVGVRICPQCRARTNWLIEHVPRSARRSITQEGQPGGEATSSSPEIVCRSSPSRSTGRPARASSRRSCKGRLTLAIASAGTTGTRAFTHPLWALQSAEPTKKA